MTRLKISCRRSRGLTSSWIEISVRVKAIEVIEVPPRAQIHHVIAEKFQSSNWAEIPSLEDARRQPSLQDAPVDLQVRQENK